MGTIVALARCSHFAPTVAVTTFATLLALAAGRGAGALWVLAAVLTGQLSVGWSNDWLDRHRDRAAGRDDKPLVRGDIPEDLLIRCAIAAVLLCAAFSLASGVLAGVVHLIAVASAWSYNLGVKSTLFSVVPYAVSFGLLPAFVTLGLDPPAWPPVWAMAAAALLGAGAHFTNAVPDLDVDTATGVRGLPHAVGRVGSLLLAAVLLGGGAVSVALGPEGPPAAAQIVALSVSLVAVAAVVALGLTGRPRLAFPATLVVAATVVMAFLAAGAQIA